MVTEFICKKSFVNVSAYYRPDLMSSV